MAVMAGQRQQTPTMMVARAGAIGVRACWG